MTCNFGWKPINEKSGSCKSFILEFERHRSMCKKSNAHLDNVSMFTFSRAVLLMGMRTGNVMRNAYAFKEGVQGLILTAPIRLYSLDFSPILAFNKRLKFMKYMKHFRFLA
jgi:hypothetical protein